MKQIDVYLESLQWAKTMADKGEPISLVDLTNHLISIGVHKNDKRLNNVTKIHNFITMGAVGYAGPMAMDAYLALLEFEEYMSAQKNALEAKKQARLAMRIAIGLGVLQLLATAAQIWIDLRK